VTAQRVEAERYAVELRRQAEEHAAAIRRQLDEEAERLATTQQETEAARKQLAEAEAELAQARASLAEARQEAATPAVEADAAPEASNGNGKVDAATLTATVDAGERKSRTLTAD